MSINYVYDRKNLDESKFGKNVKKRKFDNETFEFDDQYTSHVFCADKYSEEEAISLFKELYSLDVLSVKVIAVRHSVSGWYKWYTSEVGTRGSFPCWMITGE